jgi:hypothetical protein
MKNMKMSLIYEIRKCPVAKKSRTGLWRQAPPAFLPYRRPYFAGFLQICGSSLDMGDKVNAVAL